MDKQVYNKAKQSVDELNMPKGGEAGDGLVVLEDDLLRRAVERGLFVTMARATVKRQIETLISDEYHVMVVAMSEPAIHRLAAKTHKRNVRSAVFAASRGNIGQVRAICSYYGIRV